MMVLLREMNFIDGSFPAGTPVSVIYDLWKIPDDDRYGIQRTIERRKNYIAVELGGKNRAIAREDIRDARRTNQNPGSVNAHSGNGKSAGDSGQQRQKTVSALNRLRSEFVQNNRK
jgi:hypothetical protein